MTRLKLSIFGWLLLTFVYPVAYGSAEDWKDYQKAYLKRLSEIADGEKDDVSLGKRTIEIPELAIRDRCTSCHVAMDDPRMLGEENPLKPHPPNYLQQHPPERFGCTICHGGQGESLSLEKAQSGTFRKGDLVETSCSACHAEVLLEGAEKLTRGKSLLKELQCINCHYTQGLSEADVFKPAPALKGLADKVNEKWLWRWLKDPKSYMPNPIMPHYEIEEKYIDALVGYLMDSKDPRINSRLTYPEGDPDRGKGTLRLAFCTACHPFNGKGGKDAPDLGKIGNKVNEKWLIQRLANPHAFQRQMLANPHDFQPNTPMPRYNFSEQQISDMAAYLLDEFTDYELLEEDEALTLPSFWKSPVERSEIGRRAYKELRCANCHGLLEETGWWRKIGPELTLMGDKPLGELNFGNSNVPRTLPDYIFEKIRDPQRYSTPTNLLKMPKYDLSNAEIRDIVLALLSANANKVTAESYRYGGADSEEYEPTGEFGRLVDKFRCFSCHSFKGRGHNTTYDLTVIGSRVGEEWLFDYLKAPYTLRPILTIRMPIFNMTDKEATILTRGFMRDMVDPEIEKALAGKLTGEMVEQGKALFEQKGCLACHQVGERGGYVGPSFTQGTLVGEKLRAGWIFRWLKNSRAMKPDVVEPNYDFSDRDASALTAYLMSFKRPDQPK